MAVDDIITDPSLSVALEISRQSREQAIAILDLVSNAPQSSTHSEELQLQISKEQKKLLT
jgi:THO complex subunit 5